MFRQYYLLLAVQLAIQRGQLMTTLTDIFKDFLCGWTSGITQVFVMQPFEIVKVRLINQSFKDSYYKGTIDCFRKIRIEEGLLAFYRGTLTPLLGVGAQVSLQFAFNGLIKRFLHSIGSATGQQVEQIPSLGIVFLSGLLTGVPSSFVTTPVQRTRILMQIKKQKENSKFKRTQYKNSLHAGICLYQKYGLKGIYLGYYPTLVRQAIALCIYFGFYQLGMRFLAPQNENTSQVSVLGPFLAGGLAGCSSWLFIYPVDYIKTVIQSQSLSNLKYKSATDCAIKKYKQQGIRTFFKGFGVTMLRSFPVNGAGFFSYQLMMKLTGRQITINYDYDYAQQFQPF